jgi:glycosyltransferase EpsE
VENIKRKSKQYKIVERQAFSGDDIIVSVIMAVYNIKEPSILELSIKSILNQTIKNIELIICDDASTDNTYYIIKDIIQRDKRVKLIRNEFNMKAGGARNVCLQYVRGKYIAIMDADDFSALDRLEKQVDYLEKYPDYGFVGCKGQYFHKIVGDINEKIYWFKESPQKKDFLFSLPYVHASIMFRKEVLLDCRGYSQSKFVQRAEDYDMIMRIYQLGYEGTNIDEPLYFIREDANTYKRRKYRYRFIEVIVKLRGFYKLRLMPIGLIYALKPLFVGLIPSFLLKRISKIYYEAKNEGL